MLETSARLLRLLALLQGRRFWTGKALAEELEVTGRTLRRDVDRLRSLGYPVESSGGVAGGYQLGVGAVLPPLLLDDEEAIAISLALRTGATGSIEGIEETSLRALSKLERLLPKRLQERMRMMRTAVVPLPLLGERASAEVLTALADASRERRVVTFAYKNVSGEATDREVEPHGLVHTGVRWYLVAWDRVREDWRTFRVDRVTDAPEPRGAFTPRIVPGGDLGDYVSRSVTSAPYPVRVKVILRAPLERVASKVSPTAARLVADGPDRCRLEAGGPSLDLLALYIAAIGEELEVVEPPELRAAFERLAGRLLRAATA
ncbi:MAG: YafY family transcriptional regulator [Sandaracinaceae bacterium]|nr:YafY family transcriptional regulator [Sandaracinaceae bacterium]